MHNIQDYLTLFQRRLEDGIEQGGAASRRQEHEMADMWNLLIVNHQMSRPWRHSFLWIMGAGLSARTLLN
jgi:hypothetical protein